MNVRVPRPWIVTMLAGGLPLGVVIAFMDCSHGRQTVGSTHPRSGERGYVISATFAFANAFAARPKTLTPIGKLTHTPIEEASGLVKSRVHEGLFWVVNDSGHPPYLFAVNRTGKLLAEFELADAVNLDWESLTLDDQGRLYVGDVGNNIIPGGLPMRWVYRLKEPDPRRAAADPDGTPADVEIERAFGYTFPGMPFDVEAMFYSQGSLYLIEKGAITRLYRMSLEKSEKPPPLVEICKLPGLHSVTGADLSGDGRRLAVCSYDYAACYDLAPGESLKLLGEKTPTVIAFETTEIECCAFDGDELILGSENRTLYSLRFPPAAAKK